MRPILMCTLLLAASLYAAPARADDYKIVSAEIGGKKLADADIAGLKLTVTPTTYVLSTPQGDDKGILKRDTSKSPMTLDVIGTDGPNKGKTYLAIYKLAANGDDMTICYDLSGKSRPAAFVSTAGTAEFLVTYKRIKP